MDKLLIHQIVKGNFPFPTSVQLQNLAYSYVTNDNLAKDIECILDIQLCRFIFGQRRRVCAAHLDRLLALLCVETYGNKAISNALAEKDTNQTAFVWFLHLCYRDLAYSQPDNPTKYPWIDKQISHQYSTIYNNPRYSFHLVLD